MRRMLSDLLQSLQGHPLVLALILINLLYMAGAGYMLREVGQAAERRDGILAAIASRCLDTSK